MRTNGSARDGGTNGVIPSNQIADEAVLAAIKYRMKMWTWDIIEAEGDHEKWTYFYSCT